MNILVLTGTYPQPDDREVSATYTVQYFCEQWAQSGHRVMVFHNSSKFPVLYYLISHFFTHILEAKFGFNMPTFSSRRKIRREENGIKIYRFPLFKILPHSKFWKIQIKRQVKKIVKENKNNNFYPDVIISHWVNPQLDIIKELKKHYKVRCSLVFHGDCEKKDIKKYKIRKKIYSIDAIGCRSKTYAYKVKDQLFLKKLPFICYSGIPDSLVNKYKDNIPQKKDRNFIYVGRLVKYKNVDIIIKALNQAYGEKFHLDIVGSGGEEDNLKKLCKNLNCKNSVAFHGQLDRERVFSLLESASCFTMVSSNEVFGMVYIEAMIMGCITIATLGGGVDGIIINNKNGFLCKEKSEIDLVNIYKSIDNMTIEEIYKIRKQGVETASKFADSTIANRYLENVMDW